MNYDNYEGTIEELVRIKLKEIEDKENIKVLHAVESGSRAWGFASPDSDYDVRFIYIRPMEYYLQLQEKKDFIDWELNETLDINGWDLIKVLQHVHKSNAVMFEWAKSPIVYFTTKEWNLICEKSVDYFSCKSSMYHYYGTANKNFQKYLMEEQVKYKKYFYVLRPILACKWIEKKESIPPVLFSELLNEVLEDDMRDSVDKLVQIKVGMNEYEKGVRIDKINDYIIQNLDYYKKRMECMEDDRNVNWSELNKLFVEMLQNNHGDYLCTKS